MKIALCLGNYASCGKWGKYAYRTTCSLLKEEIINKNENVDVFLHCNEPHLKNELIELYNPVDYIFEDQINFSEEIKNLDKSHYGGHPGALTYQRLFGMMYSRYAVGQLKSKNEEKNNFKYDWVIFSRYDLTGMSNKLYFDSNFDNNYLYIPMHAQLNTGPGDVWFYSKSEIMDMVLSLYKHLVTYLSDNSDYIYTAINHWIDSNADDYLSVEILKPANEKATKMIKIPSNVLSNAHPLYKWHFYVNNLWSLDKIKFVNSDERIFRGEPHKSIIRREPLNK